MPIVGHSQNIFQRIFHPHQNRVSVTDPTFTDMTKSIPYIDGTKNTVAVEKSPAYANQPTSFKKDSVGVEPSTETNCITRKIKINAQSTSFMNASYAEQSQHIYPGAIYEFDKFWDGSFQEINKSRNPIKLSTDNPNMTGSTWVNIDEPSIFTIREGVKKIYDGFNNAIIGTMNLRYQTYEYESKSDLSIRISGGVGFPTFSIENDFKTSQKKYHHYITIDAIKPLFSINAVKSGQTYFSENVSDSKNPIIISSVVYGIRVLANIDIKTETEEEYNKFKARYSGVASHANIDFDYIKSANLNEKTINCYIVGGPGNSTISFTPEELQNGLQKLIAGVTYSTARPISYTLSDLQGNVIGTKSATDEILERDCTPVKAERKVVSAIITWKTGDDNKNNETKYSFGLYQNSINYSAPSGNTCRDDDNSKFANREDLVAWHNDCSNVEYNDGENAPTIALALNNTLSSNGFRNGGVLLLHMDSPNDTWKIANLTLTLQFDDGSTQPISWGGFSVSTFHQEQYLFFTRDFTPR